MNQVDLQTLAARLIKLGQSLPTCSPMTGQKLLVSLIADISLSVPPNGSDYDAINSHAILKAIQGVTEFNRTISPMKLELWGISHGKYFVIQSQPGASPDDFDESK